MSRVNYFDGEKKFSGIIFCCLTVALGLFFISSHKGDIIKLPSSTTESITINPIPNNKKEHRAREVTISSNQHKSQNKFQSPNQNQSQSPNQKAKSVNIVSDRDSDKKTLTTKEGPNNGFTVPSEGDKKENGPVGVTINSDNEPGPGPTPPSPKVKPNPVIIPDQKETTIRLAMLKYERVAGTKQEACLKAIEAFKEYLLNNHKIKHYGNIDMVSCQEISSKDIVFVVAEQTPRFKEGETSELYEYVKNGGKVFINCAGNVTADDVKNELSNVQNWQDVTINGFSLSKHTNRGKIIISKTSILEEENLDNVFDCLYKALFQ